MSGKFKNAEKANYKTDLLELEAISGKGVYDYVKKLDLAKWTVYANLKEKKLYGWRTTNYVVSENSAMNTIGIRGKLPFQLIEAYVDYVRADFVSKIDELKSGKIVGRIITLGASDVFAEQTREIDAYKVKKISDDSFKFLCGCNASETSRCAVKKEARAATGTNMEYHAVIWWPHYTHGSYNIIEYFDEVYKVDTYAKAFDNKFFVPPLVRKLAEANVKPPAARPRRTGKNCWCR